MKRPLFRPLFFSALAVFAFSGISAVQAMDVQDADYLAKMYIESKSYAEAEPYLREVLTGVMEKHGKNHPETATALNNLAEAYRKQGKYKEAEPLYRRALGIRKGVLGRQHPDVAQSMNNLALLFKAQARYDDADLLYREAILILEIEYPEGHKNLEIMRKNHEKLLDKMSQVGSMK